MCLTDPFWASSSVLFAISSTSDPTGSWTFYQIDADPTDVDWADYPDIGFNNTWVALTANMWSRSGGTFSGVAMWVIDKSTALAGGALTMTSFPVGSDSFGGYGGITLRPCQTFGAEPGIFEAMAYDSARMVQSILVESRPSSRKAFARALGRIADFPGVGGPTSFRRNRDARRKLTTLMVDGKKFVELESADSR